MRQPFYKKIDIEDLNVNSAEFLDHMQPLYEGLEWDQHDVERGNLKHPNRKRAVAEAIVERRGRVWNVTRVPAQPYVQPANHGNYDRTTPRVYPEPPQQATEHPEFTKLQQGMADLVSSARTGVKRLRLILTFLRTVDDDKSSGICALEGMPHTDGMEFIVSALVINRSNLQEDTGTSSVWTPDGNKLYERTLQPGEGIFQDDRNLLHHITNIQRQDQSRPGVRDMLGVDFIINPS